MMLPGGITCWLGNRYLITPVASTMAVTVPVVNLLTYFIGYSDNLLSWLYCHPIHLH